MLRHHLQDFLGRELDVDGRLALALSPSKLEILSSLGRVHEASLVALEHREQLVSALLSILHLRSLHLRLDHTKVPFKVLEKFLLGPRVVTYDGLQESRSFSEIIADILPFRIFHFVPKL